ncbi:Anaerobic glycerol-3-phosphate dehydrogenase subunit A [Klebsiella pneumoniae]|nr:Anaerobic glycerol-3-phosphate dehydrogenase subunit A [Klebsiella pneumoniae]
MENLAVNTLLDLRRRTRIGMGTCQGELCACRAAGLLQRFNVTTPAQSLTQLSEFLNERWKGVQPISWGDALRGKRIHPLGLPRPVRIATGAPG